MNRPPFLQRSPVSWTVFVLAIPAAAAANPTPVDLPQAIASAQSALANWDDPRMRTSAAQLQTCRVRGPEQAFQRAYWLGATRFGSVLHARDRAAEGVPSTDPGALREAALDALEDVVSLRPDHAESHAMMAVLHGLAISEQPLSALWRGRAFLRHRQQAEREIQTNAQVAYLLGVSLLNRADTPAKTQEALERLRQSAALFEAERDAIAPPEAPRWGYAHTLLFVGVAYERLNQPAEAANWYARAAQANPTLDRATQGYSRCMNQTANASL